MTEIVRPVVAPGRVTSGFGPRTLNGQTQLHDGIDYVTSLDKGVETSGADRSVLSICDGVVTHDQDNYNEALRWIDNHHSAGNMIIIKHNIHGVDYYCRYLHLVENSVRNGDRVEKGQVVGIYGDVGYSFGAHLHFDMYTMAWVKIDPTPILLDGLRASGIIS